MGTPIVVDCEAPFGVGAPSVGDMTEFGAVDVNALQDGRVETFHGVGCSEDTFRQFREWLTPRMPVVFVSDNPAYDFQWINFYFWRYFGENPFGHSGRRIADFYAGLVGDFRSTQKWKRLRRTSMTRSGTPKRSFVCSMGSADRRLQTERRLPERMRLDVPGDLPLRLCSRIAAHAQALLASLGYARFQEHCSFILTTKQTDDARVDKPMFALIFTN